MRKGNLVRAESLTFEGSHSHCNCKICMMLLSRWC